VNSDQDAASLPSSRELLSKVMIRLRMKTVIQPLLRKLKAILEASIDIRDEMVLMLAAKNDQIRDRMLRGSIRNRSSSMGSGDSWLISRLRNFYSNYLLKWLRDPSGIDPSSKTFDIDSKPEHQFYRPAALYWKSWFNGLESLLEETDLLDPTCVPDCDSPPRQFCENLIHSLQERLLRGVSIVEGARKTQEITSNNTRVTAQASSFKLSGILHSVSA
jgi:hypothetical protein